MERPVVGQEPGDLLDGRVKRRQEAGQHGLGLVEGGRRFDGGGAHPGRRQRLCGHGQTAGDAGRAGATVAPLFPRRATSLIDDKPRRPQPFARRPPIDVDVDVAAHAQQALDGRRILARRLPRAPIRAHLASQRVCQLQSPIVHYISILGDSVR